MRTESTIASQNLQAPSRRHAFDCGPIVRGRDLLRHPPH
jgi:hypothetical protein